MHKKLESLKNDKVKSIYKLRNRRNRDNLQLTILEGYRELSRALDFGLNIKEVFYSQDLFLGANEFELINKLEVAGAIIYNVTEQILRKISYRERPEGLIAVAEMQNHSLDNFPVVENGLYVVAETIEKPGNLGSILRSADAVCADGVIICDKCTDLYNPNVIRASTGAIFTVPIAETTSQDAFAWLKKYNIKTLAATPHSDIIYSEQDLKEGFAIIVGAEQFGLSDFWMDNSDIKVKIPMLGKIDSLNVATAATILLYEGVRQRNFVK